MLRLILITLLLPLSNAHKILVYNPKFAHSHTNFMGRIADILAEAGHDVTSLMPSIDPSADNCTTKSKIIDVKRSASTAGMYDAFAGIKSEFFTSSSLDIMKNYRTGQFFALVFSSQCRTLLEDTKLIQQLKDEKYDVMFVEHFDMCGVALVGLLKPKTYIAVSTGPVFGSIQKDEFGMPYAPTFDPGKFSMPVSHFNVHSMWDRLVNVYADFVFRVQLQFVRWEINSLFREKFGADYPSLHEIGSHSAYVFVNSEPLIDFASPTISKVIYIAGIGAQEPKKLDSEWEAVLSKRSRAVLISFGSMVKSITLPEDVKSAFVEMMKSFADVTFIWKYEEDDDFAKNVASKVENLVLSKWMPQVDILNHKNMRAFITHGGMASTQETAMRGIPGIFVPIFAEQPRNAGMMEHNGLGKVLDKNELANSAKFAEVVREVLENPSYYNSAQRTAAMLRKKPFSSKEQLIKYTEFAAKFGASAALRPQSYDMNFIEYNNLDIVFIAMLLATIVGLIGLKIFLVFMRSCMNSGKAKTE